MGPTCDFDHHPCLGVMKKVMKKTSILFTCDQIEYCPWTTIKQHWDYKLLNSQWSFSVNRDKKFCCLGQKQTYGKHYENCYQFDSLFYQV